MYKQFCVKIIAFDEQAKGKNAFMSFSLKL